MNIYDCFFNKVIENKKLVGNLNKLKGNIWEKLSFNQRKKVFYSIVSEISCFYPELGEFKFDFVVLEEGQSGQEGVEGTYLNIKMIEDGNYFEILAAFIHELRHFYQRKVTSLYKSDGQVHELFDDVEIKEIKENLYRSKFLSVDNYIEFNNLNDVEYSLQPIEFDAENFSFEFMKRFSNKFLTDSIDINNCECANFGFSKVREMKEGNVDNIVSFNKIYAFNYFDRVKNNNVVIKIENEKGKYYNSLLNKLYYLNDEQLFSLLNPGLLQNYSNDTVMSILNYYLEFNNSSTRIIKEDGKYYYNDLLFDICEITNYKLMEPLFLQIAKRK